MRALLLLAIANSWLPGSASGPDVRGGSLVYDATRVRIVLIGGRLPDGSFSPNMYAQDAATGWTDLAPASIPPERFGAGAVADSSGRIVLFGGFFPGGLRTDETWLYDPIANAWSLVGTSPAPQPRYDFGFDYDPVHAKAVLYGGCCTPGNYGWDDVWTFDFDTGVWAFVSDGTGEGGRWSPGFAYDREAKRFVLHGGVRQGHGDVGDTWTFDPATRVWSAVEAPDAVPGTRSQARLAYAGSGGVLLYGGETSNWGSEQEPLTDTWIFHSATGRWSSMRPTTDPGMRLRHALAFHGSSGEVVMFDAGTVWNYRFGVHVEDDVVAPTTPTGVRGNGWSTIFWEPSTDDVLVAGYRVFQDGAMVAAVTEASYSDDLLADGAYLFEVEAYDIAGNGSERSEPFSLVVERPVLDCFAGDTHAFGGCALSRTPSFAMKPIGLGLVALFAAVVRRRLKPPP